MSFSKKKDSKLKISDYVCNTTIILAEIELIFIIIDAIIVLTTKQTSMFSKNFVSNCLFVLLYNILMIMYSNLFNKNKLSSSEFVKIYSILTIFISILIYNLFNLYDIIYLKYLIFIAYGIEFSIFGVSIYYNYLKNENNKVKAKADMVIIFSFAVSFLGSFLLETVYFLVNLMVNKLQFSIINSLIDIGFCLIGVIIYNLIAYLSLLKSKKLINYFLIYKQN